MVVLLYAPNAGLSNRELCCRFRSFRKVVKGARFGAGAGGIQLVEWVSSGCTINSSSCITVWEVMGSNGRGHRQGGENHRSAPNRDGHPMSPLSFLLLQKQSRSVSWVRTHLKLPPFASAISRVQHCVSYACRRNTALKNAGVLCDPPRSRQTISRLTLHVYHTRTPICRHFDHLFGSDIVFFLISP